MEEKKDSRQALEAKGWWMCTHGLRILHATFLSTVCARSRRPLGGKLKPSKKRRYCARVLADVQAGLVVVRQQ